MRWVLAIACLAILAVRCRDDTPPEHFRFASFNIENFPKSQRQVDGAFREIAATGASFVALQEIYEPQRFTREMRARLGADWELAFTDTRPPGDDHPSHHLAVAFDRRAWMLVDTHVHDDTRLVEGRWKPVFEVQLRPRAGGEVVSVLDVHLKAGGDSRSIRARQYAALDTIVRRVQRTSPRVILLGDFNATDEQDPDGDRGDLEKLARATGLRWASEDLACSAFWSRDDGCFRSRLDHVLVWTSPRRVDAAGACATDGCDRGDSCPRYVEDVSDHCPVVVEM